jgi:hypothetical protein
MSDVLDMICPCENCQALLAEGAETTTADVSCRSCGGTWKAINLSDDIWPMMFDCPTCQKSRSTEFGDNPDEGSAA